MNNVLYHESGHTIASKIFDDVFEIEFVTAQSNQYDVDSLGGLKGKRKPTNQLELNDYDGLIIICLAGICTDDILNNNGSILEEFYQTKVWASKFNEPKYSGDIQLIVNYFSRINNLLNIEWINYIEITLRFLHKIINNEIVWESIVKMKNELEKSPTKTLYSNQINLIIDNTRLSNWKEENFSKIIAERSKLFINNTLSK